VWNVQARLSRATLLVRIASSGEYRAPPGSRPYERHSPACRSLADVRPANPAARRPRVIPEAVASQGRRARVIAAIQLRARAPVNRPPTPLLGVARLEFLDILGYEILVFALYTAALSAFLLIA
jgi:hypothetical protein